MVKGQNWKLLKRSIEIKSLWISLFEEKYLDHNKHEIDYWRVEKADSVIIIPVCNKKLIVPTPVFRPGAGKCTLDFPGGRVIPKHSLRETAIKILKRELNIHPKQKVQIDLEKIYSKGLFINSSFSNQKLFGFVAHIHPAQYLDQIKDVITYDIDKENFDTLMSELECLQCRALLLEFWLARHT